MTTFHSGAGRTSLCLRQHFVSSTALPALFAFLGIAVSSTAGQAQAACPVQVENASVSCDAGVTYINATPTASPASLTLDSVVVGGNVNLSTAWGVVLTRFDKTLTLTGSTTINAANYWGASVAGENGNININIGSGVSISATNPDPNLAMGVFGESRTSGDISIQSAGTVSATNTGLLGRSGNGNVTIINTGIVTSTAERGVLADTSSGTSPTPVLALVRNMGTIDSALTSIRINNYHGDAIIENSGNVLSRNRQALVVWSEDGGQAIIRNSGSVEARTALGKGLQAWNSDGNSTVENSGTVTTLSSTGIEVYAVNGSSRVVNSGTVTALTGIAGIEGNVAIENSGTIRAVGSGAKAIDLVAGSHSLTLKAGSSITGDINVAGGLLAINAEVDSSLGGNITGNGNLSKIGLGTLTLGGTVGNASTTTTIAQGGILLTGRLAGTVDVRSGGKLQVGNGIVQGDLQAAAINNGVLVFNQPGNYDYAGALSGAGSLIKQGPGLLTLSGNYTYTGSTVVEGGAVRLSAALNPSTDLVIGGGTFDLSGRNQTVAGLSGSSGTLNLGSGELVVNQNTAATYGGALAGTGFFIKRGSARLNLTGDSAFSGNTYVQGGILAVNGSLAGSNVFVQSGGTLGGNGTAKSIVSASGGKVAPGNSIGTLNVTGDVTFQAGSAYEVEVNAAGESDRINASGSASLSGGTVDVVAAPGTYRPLTLYTILAAQGGVTGKFAGVTSNFVFLDPTLRYTADTVQLALTRNNVRFADVALSPNQTATANGVETLGLGNTLYEAVAQLDASNARTAFDTLSGEVHASAVTSTYGDARLIQASILNRLRQPMTGAASVAAAFAADRAGSRSQPTPVTVPTLDPRRFALWGEGFGSWGKVDANGNAAGMDTSTGGFMIGADAILEQSYRLGIAGGFTRTTFDIDGRLSSGSNESVFGALYGSGSWGGLNLRLGTSYAVHDLDTKRTVRFPGFADQTSASYDGWTAQAFGELGYRFRVGPSTLEPFVGASVLRLHTSGFAEDGGASALVGYEQNHDLGTTTLGIRAEAQLSADMPLIVRGMVGWRHAYGDVDPSALLAFRTGPSAFGVSGVPVDRDALVAEAGLEWQANRDVSLGVSYQGQVGSQAQDHALKGNFTWRF